MLEVKYLCQLTAETRRPTILKACRYLENYKYLKGEYTLNILFDLLYGDLYGIERSKTFKVVPIRGGI